MILLSIAIRLTVAFVLFIICAFTVWQVNNYFIRKIDEKFPKKYPFKPFDKETHSEYKDFIDKHTQL